MTTVIHDISKYRLVGNNYVLAKSKMRYIKTIVVSLIICLSFVAHDAFTPTQEHKQKQQQNSAEIALQEKIIEVSNIPKEDAASISVSVLHWSKTFNVDPSLILGVIFVESEFKKYAISSAGALGLMQVLPKWHIDKLKTAKKELGNPEVFDIHTNIFLGTWILKECMSKYSNTDKSLMCYNGSVGQQTNYHVKVQKARHEFRNMNI